MKKLISFFRSIILFFTMICFAHCGGSGGSSSSRVLVFTPTVGIDCDVDDYPSCQFSSVTSNCTGELDKIHGYGTLTQLTCDNIETDYVAQSSGQLLCDSFGCSGTLTRWFNESGEEVDVVPGGVTRVCVSIDINCNGERDSGDLIFETEVNIHDNSPTIDANVWTAQ
jgi:hypothetical protein